MAGASGGSKADPPDVLAAILGAHPESCATVVANPDEHPLHILHTPIDRDAANRPPFRSFPCRLADALDLSGPDARDRRTRAGSSGRPARLGPRRAT